MKFSKKLIPLAVVSSLAAPAMMMATPAQAELSADITMSNMYLWRGLNLTPDGAAISGTLQYDHASGFYAGAWTSSEAGGHETDLYLGFGGEAGPLSYDVSWWAYLYPEDRDDDGRLVDITDNDSSELVISLGVSYFNFTAYIQTDDDNDDNNYFTLSASNDTFSLTYGFWDLENAATDDDDTGSETFGDYFDEYSHLTLGYSATDELSFAVSVAFSDLDDDDARAVETDPLFQVAYTLGFEL